jgi:hypothetical protein
MIGFKHSAELISVVLLKCDTWSSKMLSNWVNQVLNTSSAKAWIKTSTTGLTYKTGWGRQTMNKSNYTMTTRSIQSGLVPLPAFYPQVQNQLNCLCNTNKNRHLTSCKPKWFSTTDSHSCADSKQGSRMGVKLCSYGSLTILPENNICNNGQTYSTGRCLTNGWQGFNSKLTRHVDKSNPDSRK